MALANNYLNMSTTSSLRVCRGCLATDARLYDMRQDRLMEAYNTLLSTAVQVTDDLPHYLCSYCAVLLLKCDAFRTKCIDSLIVLRNAQHQHLDIATEHIKNVGQSKYYKKIIYNNINIVDKTLKRNHSVISTDTDISSESDISLDSDESLDYDLKDNTDSSDSDVNIHHLKAKSKFSKHKIYDKVPDYTANYFSNVIKSLLKNYSDTERIGLLKDFKVNLDCEESKGISNIRDHHMHQLSEIINHIQYSSERSNEILKILNEDPPNCKNKATKSVTTIKKTRVIKQEFKSNAKAKTINKQEVVQKGKEHEQKDTVQENTNISILERHIDIKPIIKDVIKTDDVKLEVSKYETNEIEIQFEEINETLDSEDDIATADLKLDSKPSKYKQIGANYRGCEKFINGILKGRDTKKKFTDEIYGMYNTEVRHLSKEEQINEINKRKESDNYKNGQFKCDICFKGFLIDETYKNHMLLHDDISGKFVCDICHCHFMTSKRLIGHKKGHAKLYICKECGHTTCHATQAAEHYKWHSGKKFSCETCGKEFKKNSSKYGHIKVCHPNSEQLVRCEICGDSFNGLGGLKYHDNRSHKEMYSPECLCSGCGTQFYCSDAFKAHQGTDGLCDTIHKYCVRCGMSFETEELLKEHEIEQRKPRNDFDCEVCHKKFKLFWKLKSHQRCHSTSYPNYLKLYNARSSLRDKEKYGNEAMICEVCGKTVKNSGLLKLHYSLVHSTDKPFKCTICSKAFKTSSILVTHQRVHTGERPFQCQICPKAFQNPQNLKRHNIVHTGERPHSCDVCGKSFQSKGCVQMHIKTVHMKIPMPPRIRRRNKKTE